MRILVTLATLAVFTASISGYYGYLHTRFNEVVESSKKYRAKRQYGLAINGIDELRQERFYQAIKMYPPLDIFEVDKHLDYQKGCMEANLSKLEDALVLFDRCAEANDKKLAGDCLYQQGNIALYRGNLKTAEKKWQEAQEKYPGGHDHDAQVNLELLKNDQKKAAAMAARAGALLTHRRNNSPYMLPHQRDGQSKVIKP